MAHLRGGDEVSEVDRIEGSSHDPDPGGHGTSGSHLLSKLSDPLHLPDKRPSPSD